jgi:hypothetical protein
VQLFPSLLCSLLLLLRASCLPLAAHFNGHKKSPKQKDEPQKPQAIPWKSQDTITDIVTILNNLSLILVVFIE